MASVKPSVPVTAESSSEPVADVLPVKEPGSFTDATIRLMTCVSVWPSRHQ